MRGSFLYSLFVVAAVAGAQVTPPVAPVRPVTDIYFGTTVVDPYRWMETGGDELLSYMKAENAVTQQALQPFASQDAQILSELTKLADTVTSVAPARAIVG
jgi:prolyl oligopeptidase